MARSPFWVCSILALRSALTSYLLICTSIRGENLLNASFSSLYFWRRASLRVSILPLAISSSSALFFLSSSIIDQQCRMSSFISMSSSSSSICPCETASSSLTVGRRPLPALLKLDLRSILSILRMELPCASSMSFSELEEQEEMLRPDLRRTRDSVMTLDSSLEWSSCIRFMFSLSYSISFSLTATFFWMQSSSLAVFYSSFSREDSVYCNWMFFSISSCTSSLCCFSIFCCCAYHSAAASSCSCFILAIASSKPRRLASFCLCCFASSLVNDSMLMFLFSNSYASLVSSFYRKWLFSLQKERMPMVRLFQSYFLPYTAWISLFFQSYRASRLFRRMLFSLMRRQRLLVYSIEF